MAINGCCNTLLRKIHDHRLSVDRYSIMELLLT
ncbi:hypothetical protein V12B01_13075 [Vibrio splendidus 12B01]|nr:hypothetical protein V12B01_13075 [Vibrio splendidus 12B01]